VVEVVVEIGCEPDDGVWWWLADSFEVTPNNCRSEDVLKPFRPLVKQPSVCGFGTVVPALEGVVTRSFFVSVFAFMGLVHVSFEVLVSPVLELAAPVCLQE
jgi:hypothetical protein